MMKFKKFLAAAMTGAMMFGSIAMATPVAYVYADASDSATSVKEVTVRGVKFVAPGTVRYYDASSKDQDGNYVRGDSYTWSVAGSSCLNANPENVDPEKTSIDTNGNLHVGTKETAEKLTIKATSQTTNTVSGTFEVSIFAGVVCKIDYYDMTATLSDTTGENTFYFLEVSKKKDDPQGKGSIYCYESRYGEDVIVDLSFMKLSKEAYVYAYGDKNTTAHEQVIITQQDKKPTIKFKNGKWEFKGNEVGEKTVEYQYGGYWHSMEELTDGDPYNGELEQMQITGTTLPMRKAATEKTFASPEVKVKISANAKAPKVTADYGKNVVKLTKNAEIRVPGWYLPTEDGEEEPFYYPVGENKELLSQDPNTLTENIVNAYVDKMKTTSGSAISAEEKQELLDDLRDGCSILVRTNDSKKGISQPAFLEIKEIPVIEVKTVSGSAVSSTIAVVTGEDENGNKTYGKELEFSYDMTADKDKGEVTLKGEGFAYSTDGKKYTSIKNGSATVKLSKVTNEQGIMVRLANQADKKDPTKNTWASNALPLPETITKVEIDGDKAITAKADSTVEKTYKAKVTNNKGKEVTNPVVTWEVDDTSKATIDATGKLTVTKAASGKIKITATCNGVSGTLEVEITAPATTTP